jgi:flagellar basal-body rod modification protein FlgD
MDISAVNTSNAAQTAQSRQTLSGNFDTFLKLLTTQLQNQDPLEPLDSTKFTEQLVSYSQVEQQINTNSKLSSLLAVATTSLGANAVSYLGKVALTADSTSSLVNGAAEWRYNVPAGATSVQLSISDANGNVVRTLAGETGSGAHDFAWDGMNSAGTQLADGQYRLTVTAKDVNGDSLTPTVSGVGLVKEIDMSGSEPLLTIGSRVVSLTSIIGFKN